ncbi:Pentaxin [Rhodopirellula europaea 6C]|uniref:Pentaxin n=2 Tax=Rhodopirellula TaxID=265488 RepID=M2BAF3_9BACT|nr:Pentaxin [Rhodopirellula europaea 6C]
MSKRDFHFFQLEDRVLLSGEGLEAIDVVAPDAELLESLNAELDSIDAALNDINASDVTPDGEARRPKDDPEFYDPADGPLTMDPARPIEVIFIDDGVQDSDTLVQNLRDQNEDTQWVIVRLSSDESGVNQISLALSMLQGVDAIHLVSHGDGEAIQLGSDRLSIDSAPSFAGDIASWGHSLDAQADLLIYGCDLASTTEGQDLIDILALVCDCDVAASDDATGHADLGGDWILEYSVGDVETDVAFGFVAQASWHQTLDLTASGGETLVNATATANQETRPLSGNVDMDESGRYVVVWDDYQNGDSDVYAKVYDADGTVLTADFRVHSASTSAQDWGSVTMAENGNFLVTWDDARSGTYETYMRLFDVNGNALTAETQVSGLSGGQANTSADFAADGSFVVVFESLTEPNVYLQRYNASGVAQGTNTLINTTTSGTQQNAVVAVADDGSFVVTWESENQDDGISYGIYAQRYDASGVAQGSNFLVNQTIAGNQQYANVDSDAEGNFVVTWTSSDGNQDGTWARRFDSSGSALDDEFQVNTYTQGNQARSHVDMNATGDFMITWNSASQDGNGGGVYAQQFNSDGVRVSEEVLVNTTTSNEQGNTTVALSGDKAVVAWSGNGPGDAQGVFTQRFSTNSLSPLVVDTTSDVIDGTVTDVASLLADRGADGFISLREAIIAVNNDSVTNWRIDVGSGTYTFAAGAGDTAGDFDIRNSVQIVGAGIGSTIIDANQNDRVFEVFSGSVVFQDMTIQGGQGTVVGSGIDVNVGADVTLDTVRMFNNESNNAGGGAVLNAGTLTILDSEFESNNATGAEGGAIRNSGDLTIERTTFTDNWSSNSLGGALYQAGTGTATITDSLFVGNSSTLNSGGAIYGAGVLTITNTTFSGNSAGASHHGSAIFVTNGTTTLQNVTATGNTHGDGGAVRVTSTGTLDIRNTIIAGNTGGGADDLSSVGTINDLGYNLIGDGTGQSVLVDGVNGNQVGTSGSPLDPMLEALADNGGATWTHALLGASTAIDAGSNTDAPPADQRGVARDSSVDIGAYEFVAPIGLLAHYKFDPQTGATDSSENSLDGTFVGNASIDTTSGTNQVGNGKLTLDGTGDYVDLTSSISRFDDLSEGTISAWVNTTDTGFNTILDINDGTTSNFASLWIDNGQLIWSVNVGGSSLVRATSTATINDGNWHHIAVTTDGTGTSVYIDGLELSGGAVTYSSSTDTTAFFDDITGATTISLGAYNSGGVGGEFDGLVDDVRIYNYAVTDSDMSDLYAYRSASPNDLAITDTTQGGISINEDGGNDAYFIADDGDSVLGGLTEFTIEMQFSSTSITNQTTLFSYATAADSNALLSIVSGTTLLLYTDGASYSFSGFDFTSLGDGELHGIAMTWDSVTGEAELHVDGVVKSTISSVAVGHSIAVGGTLVFGQEQDSVDGGYVASQIFRGTLHDVRVFDDVRTAGEIGASYRSELPYDEANLLANWKFDGLSPDGIVTESVSGNNLTIKHTSESGFTASKAALTLAIDENTISGSVVGSVSGQDAERAARIASLLAADANLRYSAETGKFYELINVSAVWTTAQSSANSNMLGGVSGQLLTIGSAAENELATLFANELGGDVWLGYSDQVVEGEFQEYTGTTAGKVVWRGAASGYRVDDAYSNWAAGEPNDDGGQDFAKLYVNGTWDDEGSGAMVRSIVEWNADAVLDATDAVTYTIQSQTVAGAFAIDTSTGTITVADGSLLNYESQASHSLTVRVTDEDSNTYDEVFTVSLNDLAESNNAPSDVSSGIELNTDGGNDAYLAAADADFLLGADGHTYEVRFSGLTDIAPGGMATFYTQRDFGSAQSYLAIHDDGTLDWAGLTSSGQYTQLLDGDVHSLAITWDASAGHIAFYVDGEYVESTSVASQAGSTGGDTFVLGQHVDYSTGSFDSDEAFKGTFHDFRVWDHARGAEEIALNYQQKLDFTPAEATAEGLMANWQFDVFNGSNEVVDIVTAGTGSENNLSIGHAVGTGFTASTPVEDLHVAENTTNGSTVGFVLPSAPDVAEDIAGDGLFNEATPSTTQYGVTGTFGDWTVTEASIDLFATTDWESPLGGRVVNLDGSAPGAIEQNLTTVAGRQYQVVFALTGDFSGGDAVKNLRVSASGTSVDYQATQESNWSWGEIGAFEQRSFTFTADDTTSVLQFRSLEGPTSTYGPYIADVQVIEIPAAVTTILNDDPTLSYDAATGKFYKLVTNAVDVTTAMSSASSDLINGVGGQLVTIRSSYENELVQDIVSRAGSEFYIGGTDATSEGNWNWIEDGVEADNFWVGDELGAAPAGVYANFNSIEPNDFGGNEDYLAIYGSTGEWLDLSGADNRGCIIEWNASEVLSNFTFSLNDDAGGRFAIDSNTGEITVADGSQLDYEVAVSHNITVQATDASGNSYSEVMAIALDDLAESTSVVVPIAQSINEDTSLTFSTVGGNAIVVAGGGLDDPILSVSLSVANGSLTLATTSGITFLDGTNDGDASIVISGAESDLNTALDGLQYLGNQDYNGSDTLTVTTGSNAGVEANLYARYEFAGGSTTDDSGNGYDGSASGNPSLTTDAERGDVMTFDGDDKVVVTNGTLGLGGEVTIAAWVNLDAGQGDAVAISLGDRFFIELDNNSSGWGVGAAAFGSGTYTAGAGEIDVAGTGWRHVAATFSDANDELRLYIDGNLERTFTGLTQVPDWASYSSQDIVIGDRVDSTAPMVGSLDDVRVYNAALSETEIVAMMGDQGYASETVAITVTAVNDAPVMTASSPTYPATEDGAPFAASVSAFLGSTVTDADAGAVEGAAIYGSAGSGGTLEYSINGGSSWTLIPSVDATSALLLRANDLIRFTPDTENGGTLTLDYHAWDQTSGTAGGTADVTTRGGSTAFSTADNTVTVTVADVNDEQVISTNNGATFTEGSAGNTITSSMLETTDVDNTAGELTYTVTANPGHGQLKLDGLVTTSFTQSEIDAGRITYDHDDSENLADSFSFSVDDGAGSASTGSFSITLNPINDNAVAITSDGGGATASINVNETVSFVTQVTVSDADMPGDTMTYSITGGADQNDFTIDSGGNLTFVNPPDYESPADDDLDNVYTVTVQVSDGVHTDSQSITVTVQDVQNSSLTVTTTSDVDDTGLGATYTIEELYAVGGGTDGEVSLREAITAANGTLGQDTINFAILNTDAGYTGTPGVDAYWQISLTAALPTITESVILDGTSQTVFGGDVNPGSLGVSNEAGTNDQAISSVERPEIAIIGASGFDGLVVGADNVTVQGFAMFGFSSDAAIYISDAVINTVIDSNVFGVSATGISDPGAALNNQIHVQSVGADNGILSNNILAYSKAAAIHASNASDGWSITGNQFVNSGFNYSNGDAIAMNGSTGGTIDGNYIAGSSTQAILLSGSTSGVTITDNTIVGNGVGPSSGSEVQFDAIAFRSGTNDITLRHNIIADNYGAGITVNDGAYGIEITQNSMYGNGTILSRQGAAASDIVAIDLQTTGEDAAFGTAPYYTPNDAGDADTGGNSLQNFPVIDSASTDGTQLAVSGSFNSLAARTYRIEFFLTDEYASGHGQGETYLGSIDVTTDGSGNATFDTNFVAALPSGTLVTATATDLTTKETSEFSQQFAVNDTPHILGSDLVTNGQFTSDASGWNVSGNLDHDGSQMRFGQIGGAPGVLSQTLTTEIGKEYFLTFRYGDGSATQSQSIQLDVNGSAFLLDEAIASDVASMLLQPYTYSFVADSTSTTLTFTDTSADHSGVRGYLDDVEVREASAPAWADLDYTENDSATVVFPDVNLADVDDTQLESAVVRISANFVLSEDVLAAVDQFGIVSTWNSGTGELTLTGTATVEQYETVLASVTYENTDNSPSTATRTIEVVVNDGDGDSNVLSRDVTVESVNDDPYNNGSLPASITVTEDVASNVDLSSIDLRDVDGSGGQDLSIKLSTSTGGNLYATTTADVTVVGSGTSTLTLTGARGDLNAFLDIATSITYQHATPNVNGVAADSIQVAANDNGNTGTGGGTDQVFGNVSVDITAVNDAPTISTGFDTMVGEFGGNTTTSIIGKATLESTNRIAVDSDQTYELSVTAWSGDGVGGNYDAGESHYLGFYSYDIDGNQITSQHTGHYAGAADTTLAIDLVAGATEIVLTDATGWYEGGTQNNRSFAWYGYTNSLGETYADYTYTRNVETNLWDAGAIDHVTGVITLREAWSGPTILAGEAVRNMSPTGGTYQYPLLSNGPIDETGGDYSIVIGGANDTGATSQTQFRHGTAYIAPLVLANYTGTSNELNISDFTVATQQGTTVFTEDAGPIAIIDNDFAITDADDTFAESMTITLTNGKLGDILNVDESAIKALGISVIGIPSGNLTADGSITLTLTSDTPDTVTFADYQAALNEITFDNNSDDPDTTDRTMTFVVNDGDVDSAAENLVIKVHAVDDAPVVSTTADNPTFTEGGAAVSVFSGTTIDAVELGDTIGSFSISIDGVADGAHEQYRINSEYIELVDGNEGLTDSSGFSYSVSVNAGVATVTLSRDFGIGPGTAAALINNSAYQNTSDAPTGTTRTVTLETVTEFEQDGVNDTTVVGTQSVITIAGVNDAPEFVGPELISNGTFDTDLSGWSTVGSTAYTSGEMNFGGGNAVGPHTASQTIATEAGQTYRLTFDYRDGSDLKNQSLQVTVDGDSNLLTTSHIVTDIDGNTFVRYEYTFTADSSASTITFNDTSDTAGLSDDTNNVDGRIDNVSVQQINGHVGSASFTEGGSAVVLDGDLTLFDDEIAAGLDNYNNTILRISRNGGASGDDVFGASGNLASLTETGSLVLNGETIGTVDQNSGGQLTLRFNTNLDAAKLNEVLQSITYENTSDAPPVSLQLNWEFDDDNFGTQQGTSGELTGTAYTVVNISGTNDAPELDNSGTPTVTSITEDQINNAGMTVADLLATGAGGDPISDADSDPEGIAITARINGNGQWQYSTDGGTNWSAVGTVSENSALLLRSTDLVRFQPDGDNGVTQTFEFRAWDQTSGTEGTKVDTTTNGGTTAFSTAIESASITVTHVNDAPTLDNSPALTLTTQTEDAGVPVGAVGTLVTDLVSLGGNVGDVDNNAQTGIALISADTTNGTWWFTTDGGTNWNALGTVSDSSARVLEANTSTRIYFQSDADFNGTITDAIRFRAWDRTVGTNGSLEDATLVGGTTAFSSAVERADQTITPVNDAPQLDFSFSTSLNTINEDAVDNAGQTVASILSSSGQDILTDVDGDPEGIAIIVSNPGNGTWEYSLDGGTIWTDIGSVSNSNALLLRSTDLVRFNPDGENGTLANFGFRGWDQTNGTAGTHHNISSTGGPSAFSNSTESALITVTDVNDAPVLDNSANLILTAQTEDAGAPSGAVGTVITDLVSLGGNVTDVDASVQTGVAITAADTANGTWWYTTDGGTNWNALGSVSDSSARVLNANSNTRIYFEANADFNGTISNAITFRAWDRSLGSNGSLQDASTNGGTTAFSSASETADLTITATNDEEVVSTNTGATFTENSTGNVVTTAMLHTSDVDNTSAQLIYTLTSDATTGSLYRNGTLIGNGDTFTQADIDAGLVTYDHDGAEVFSDSFGFSVDDGAGNASTGTFNLTITPVNDQTPTITSDGGGRRPVLMSTKRSLL